MFFPSYPVVLIRLRLEIVFWSVKYYFCFFLFDLRYCFQCDFILLCFVSLDTIVCWLLLMYRFFLGTWNLFLSSGFGFKFVYNVAFIIGYYWFTIIVLVGCVQHPF